MVVSGAWLRGPAQVMTNNDNQLQTKLRALAPLSQTGSQTPETMRKYLGQPCLSVYVY